MFLVQAVLESAVTVAQAEQAQRVNEQLRQEIEGVRTLQEAIIPHGLNPPAGYRIAARYEPAQVTVLGGKPVVLAGGDYYDLFCPDGHTLTALIGDASGHARAEFGAQFPLGLGDRALGAAAEIDTPAVAQQRFDDGAPDAPAAAGNQRDTMGLRGHGGRL